jgi:hypothetical protein
MQTVMVGEVFIGKTMMLPLTITKLTFLEIRFVHSIPSNEFFVI